MIRTLMAVVVGLVVAGGATTASASLLGYDHINGVFISIDTNSATALSLGFGAIGGTPEGMASDTNGNVWLLQSDASSFYFERWNIFSQSVDITPVFATNPGAGGQTNGLAVSSSGDFYTIQQGIDPSVPNALPMAFLRVDPSVGTLSTVPLQDQGTHFAFDFIFTASGSIVTLDAADDRIKYFDPLTGIFLSQGSRHNPVPLGSARALAADTDGLLYTAGIEDPFGNSNSLIRLHSITGDPVVIGSLGQREVRFLTDFPTPIPLPPAAWLFLTGLGLVGAAA